MLLKKTVSLPKFLEMLNEILLAVILLVIVAILVMLAVVLSRLNLSPKVEDDKCIDNHNDISYKTILPLKIQAYERLMLYLERIQFPMLVKRIYSPGMSLNSFHVSLNQSVREEFEHNMAQQLYVSPTAWQAVNSALDDVLRQINDTFGQLPQDCESATAAQQIIKLDNSMIASAIARIKFEFDTL